MDRAAAAKNRERHQRKRGSSKFVGVRIRKRGKYGAEITFPGNGRKWLGTFDTELAAALAYDKAARSYGFAEIRCNFPQSPTPPLPSPPPSPSPESSGEGAESGEPENSEMPPESSDEGSESDDEPIKSERLLPFQINLNYPPPEF